MLHNGDERFLHVWLQPAHLVRMWLNAVLWGVGATVYVAETLMWYQVGQ